MALPPSDQMLEEIVKDKKLSKNFVAFLKEKHQDEWFLFWLAVDHYKHIESLYERKEKAEEIRKTFFDEQSDLCISINPEYKQIIDKDYGSASPQLFSLAQRSILPNIVDSLRDFYLQTSAFPPPLCLSASLLSPPPKKPLLISLLSVLFPSSLTPSFLFSRFLSIDKEKKSKKKPGISFSAKDAIEASVAMSVKSSLPSSPSKEEKGN